MTAENAMKKKTQHLKFQMGTSDADSSSSLHSALSSTTLQAPREHYTASIALAFNNVATPNYFL